MLQTTSAQLLDSIQRNDSSGINPIRIGAVLDQTSTAQIMYTVPKGQVLLITQVAMQVEGSYGIVSPFPTSPTGLISGGLVIKDGDGDERGTLAFWHFRRGQTTFGSGSSPDWMSAPPGNTVQWKPKYALPVPAGWTVNTGTPIGGNLGNFNACYGVVVDEDSARTLGYQVNPDGTDADNRHGVESLAATGTLVAAVTGMHIRVLDVSIRMQAEVPETTVKLTLDQGTGGEVLHEITSNNPSDLIEQNFSPSSWYLGAGESLDLTLSVANTASVTVTYEYVEPDDVPGDVFWGSVVPAYPTPDTAGYSVAKPRSTSIDLFYPRYGTTLTTQNGGDQHWIEGYSISVQKKSGADVSFPEQLYVAISTGSAGDPIETALTAVRSNYQISPVFSCSGHDQNVNIVVDDIWVPCAPNVGNIYVDVLGLDDASTGTNALLSTPDTQDLDTDEFRVGVWGRTSPAMITTPDNEGT